MTRRHMYCIPRVPMVRRETVEESRKEFRSKIAQAAKAESPKPDKK